MILFSAVLSIGNEGSSGKKWYREALDLFTNSQWCLVVVNSATPFISGQYDKATFSFFRVILSKLNIDT